MTRILWALLAWTALVAACGAPPRISEIHRLEAALGADPESWELRVEYARALLSPDEQITVGERVSRARRAAVVLAPSSPNEAVPPVATVLRARAQLVARQPGPALAELEQALAGTEKVPVEVDPEISSLLVDLGRALRPDLEGSEEEGDGRQDEGRDKRAAEAGRQPSKTESLIRVLRLAGRLGQVQARREEWVEICTPVLRQLFERRYDRSVVEVAGLLLHAELPPSELHLYAGVASMARVGKGVETAEVGALDRYLAPRGTAAEQAERHLRAAQALQVRYRHDEAMAQIETALRLVPDKDEVRLLKVAVLLRGGKKELAADAARDYVLRSESGARTPEGSLQALSELVSDLGAFGLGALALDLSLSVSEREPDLTPKVLRLAASAVRGGEAQARLGAAVRSRAEIAEADELVELSSILERAGDRKGAAALLEPRCARGPAKLTVTCVRLAVALGETTVARRHGKALLRPELIAPEAHAAVGPLRGAGLGALADRLTAALLARDDAPLPLYREEAERRLGSSERARRAEADALLEEAARKHKEGKGALMAAEVLVRSGRISDAVTWYRRAAGESEGPERARALLAAARLSPHVPGRGGVQLGADLRAILEAAEDEPEVLDGVIEVARGSSVHDGVRVEALERRLRVRPTDDTMLELGTVLCRSGHAGRGVSVLLRFVRGSPTPVKAFRRVLDGFRHSGDPGSLLRVFREGPAAVREDPGAVRATAELLNRRGERDASKLVFARLVDLLEADLTALRELAGRLTRYGYLQLALDAYLAAGLSIPPGRYDLTVFRAAIRAGRMDLARKHAERFVQAAPRPAQALEQVGNIFYDQLRFEEAFRFLKEALEHMGDERPARLVTRLVDLSAKLGRKDDLVAYARELVPDPEDHQVPDSHLEQIAEALVSAGLREEAFRYRVEWARRGPQVPERWLRLAELHMDVGRADEALEACALAYDQAPESQRQATLTRTRRMLLSRSRADLLARLCARLRSEHPGTTWISEREGEALLLLGRAEEGHRALVRALHEAEEPREVWERLFELLRKLAPPQLAAGFARDAAAVLPDEPELYRALGDVLLDLGREERALDVYERHLSLAPSRAAKVATRLYRAGRFEDALRFYRVAAAHVTEEDAAKVLSRYFELARAWRGDVGARDALVFVLRERGFDAWVLRACTDALVEVGLLDEAARLMRELVEREASTDDYKRLAILALLRRDFEEMNLHLRVYLAHAEADSPPARRDRPGMVDAALMRSVEIAEMLANEGLHEDALRWMEEARRRSPRSVQALSADAYVALRAKRLTRAMSSTRAALELDPGKALAIARSVFDYAARTGHSCAFLPLLQDLGTEAGPLRPILHYELAAFCAAATGSGDAAAEAERALAEALEASEIGGDETLSMAGEIALITGRYGDAAHIFRSQLDRRGEDALGNEEEDQPGPLRGLIRALHAQSAEEGERAGADEAVAKIVDRLWRNASAPAQALDRLSASLGPRIGRWDLAADLCDRLLAIEPTRGQVWVRRVDIALQRPDEDDLQEILERLVASGGPRLAAFDRVRSVWLETGRSDELGEVRRRLGLPEQANTVVEVWRRAEEALAALDEGAAREALSRYLRLAGETPGAHRRVVAALTGAGWMPEAAARVARARKAHPGDVGLRWLELELRLSSGEGREAAVDELRGWVRQAGLAPTDDPHLLGTGSLARVLTGAEILSLAEPGKKLSGAMPEPELLEAIGLLRVGRVDEAAALAQRFEAGAVDVPRALLVLAAEAAAAGREELARKLSAGVRRWAGYIAGSQHLIGAFENLLTHRDLPERQRKVLAQLGVEAVHAYLAVAAPGVATTTNLATFRAVKDGPEAAVLDYQAMLEHLPGEAALFNNLAYHDAVYGVHLEEGERLVEMAIRMEPSSATYYLDTRGWVRHRLGRQAAAAEDVDASLRLAPLIRGFSSEEAQIHAAEIALVRGQEEKAARHAVRARSLAPRQKIGDRALQILRQVRPGWAGEAGAKLGEDGT